jgi:cysteinyl-tRNA synthetase
MQLVLYNTFSGRLEDFDPLDKSNVRMYVCGPTVYHRPHIGNIRSALVYDVLFRTLLYLYPHVTYVRNITDVDDKIIAAAAERKISVQQLTREVTELYHQDLKVISCLSPTAEPRATAYISKMVQMIELLMQRGYAYQKGGEVLFDTGQYKNYGHLSKRSLDQMLMGARVEVAEHKKDPKDFVLWKLAKKGEEDCSFDSPWGKGRPGWHIECSAMSMDLLGADFDIHGGGMDLVFPHHENERAQSCCAAPNVGFAKYWVHNAFLSIDDEKMSKSLGNFTNIPEIIKKDISGQAIRYFLLSARYRKPLDLNEKALRDAENAVKKFASVVHKFSEDFEINTEVLAEKKYAQDIAKLLCDDLNTPKALAHLHYLADDVLKNPNKEGVLYLLSSCALLGINLDKVILNNIDDIDNKSIPEAVRILAESRKRAKLNREWAEADRIRSNIEELGYRIEDREGGEYILKSLQKY